MRTSNSSLSSHRLFFTILILFASGISSFSQEVATEWQRKRGFNSTDYSSLLVVDGKHFLSFIDELYRSDDHGKSFKKLESFPLQKGESLSSKLYRDGNKIYTSRIQNCVVPSWQIDKTKWDYLSSQPTMGGLYSSYDYLMLCEGEWEGFIEFENGSYSCATAIQFRRRGHMKYIYQSPQIPFASILTTKENVAEFLVRLNEYLESYKYVARHNLLGHHWLKGNPNSNFGLAINLNQSYQALHQNYTKYRKIRLRKALRYKQEVAQCFDIALFTKIHEQFTLPRITGIERGQEKVIGLLWLQLNLNGQVEIYSCSENDNVLGAFLLGKYGRSLYYLASVSTVEGRKKNAQTLIIDHILRKYAGTDYAVLDMGPCAKETIDQFKGSFGAVPYAAHQLYKNHLPIAYKVAKWILNRLRIRVGERVY